MTSLQTLAAAQTIPQRGDVAANVAAHERLLRAAAEERVDLLVFPELSLTGYELDLASELSFSEEDERLLSLRRLAASFCMTLVVGAPVRLDQRLHIGAFILSPDGAVGLYTKQHLGAFPPEASPSGRVPPGEPTLFQPGTRDPLLDFDGVAAALAICADIGRPSHPEHAAKRGAKLYLASLFVLPSDLAAEISGLKSYAAQHGLTVVAANYGGPSGGLDAAGGSAIISERGELVTQLPVAGDGLAIATRAPAGWRGRARVLASD